MKKPFVIDLNRDINKLEFYEVAGENLMQVRVQAPGIKDIQCKGYKAELALSIDGMLGLGTELIRKALLAKEYGLDGLGGLEEIYSIEKDSATKYMGIYLMPESAQVLLMVIEHPEKEMQNENLS